MQFVTVNCIVLVQRHINCLSVVATARKDIMLSMSESETYVSFLYEFLKVPIFMAAYLTKSKGNLLWRDVNKLIFTVHSG